MRPGGPIQQKSASGGHKWLFWGMLPGGLVGSDIWVRVEARHPPVPPGPGRDSGWPLDPGELPAGGAHVRFHGPPSTPLSHRSVVTRFVCKPVLERGVVGGGEQGPSSARGVRTWLRAGHGSGAVLGRVGCVDGRVLGLLDRSGAS